MNRQNLSADGSFSPPQRWLLAGTAVVLAGLLALATCLVPDARGLGTHEQLGWPACSFLTLWGVRCPSCGMTTSWAHLVRGEVVGALQANAGGALLGLIAIVSAPWLSVSAAAGRWLGIRPSPAAVMLLSAAVMAVTLIGWLARLLAP